MRKKRKGLLKSVTKEEGQGVCRGFATSLSSLWLSLRWQTDLKIPKWQLSLSTENWNAKAAAGNWSVTLPAQATE